ncbi:MAG: dihydrodipicolinate synthase family protein [Acidobacteriia bacterium]|nr:dihydrodipicolinate synthase family protein [Terriglobia bacterium]
MKVQGIFIPIAIPFDHNGDLYPVKVQHNIEKWNRTGVSGYVVCGAESVYLSSAEKTRIWELVAQSAAPEKLRIAATGAPSVHESIELTCRAAQLGYQAIWLQHPEPIYICSIADRSPVPVITDAAVAHPNVVSGITASQTKLAEAFAAGASAAIADIANAAPYAAISIWEAHRTREYDAAIDWQNRIARAVELTSSNPAALKHAMDLNGYYGGPPRLPLIGLTPDARREIEAAFDGLKG